MKILDATLKARLTSGTTQLCRLVLLALVNGTNIYLTDSDRDVVWAGNTYKSAYGVNVSQVQLVLGVAAQSATIDVLIDPAGITTQMIEQGLLDDAKYSISVFDFGMPTLAPILFFVGFVSKVAYKDRLHATIQGMPPSARNLPLALDKYSSNCRADLGDAKCKVPLAPTAATIVSASDIQTFHCSSAAIDATWNDGLAQFTSGPNNGISFEVNTSLHTGVITLKGLFLQLPGVGDTLNLYPGCDKTAFTCFTKFNNILNFRGENFSIAPFNVTATAPANVPTVTAAAITPPPKDTVIKGISVGTYETTTGVFINITSLGQ